MRDMVLCQLRALRRADHGGCFLISAQSARPSGDKKPGGCLAAANTLHLPSIKTCSKTGSCFVGVFDVPNQGHARLCIKNKRLPDLPSCTPTRPLRIPHW